MLELLTTLRAPASPAQSVLAGGTEERAEGARRRSAGESEGALAPSLKNRRSPPPSELQLAAALLPVLQKLLEPDVGERVLDELLQTRNRHRDHLGAGLAAVDHLARAADRGGQHPRLDALHPANPASVPP